VSFASWFRGLEGVLGPLDAEIKSQQGRPPDLGDLLLVLACGPTLGGKALRDIDVDLVKLAKGIEQARSEVERDRAYEEIEAAQQAKQEAIEAQDWDRVAELRERERGLVGTDRERHSTQAEEMRTKARRLLRLSKPHSGS
jgi:hypothetical protein